MVPDFGIRHSKMALIPMHRKLLQPPAAAFCVLYFLFQDRPDLGFRQKIIRQWKAKFFCQSTDDLAGSCGIDIFCFRFRDSKIPHKLKDLGRPIRILQDFELQDPFQKDGKITDQEMSFDCLFLLAKRRPCIQVRLHDFKGFLDPPEVVVGFIDILIPHPCFGSNQEIVASKL